MDRVLPATLRNCLIEYGGGYSSDSGMVHAEEAAPGLRECTLQHSASYGVAFDNSGPLDFAANIITANAQAPIKIGFAQVGKIGTGTYTGNTDDHIILTGDTLSVNATCLKQDIPYLLQGIGTITGATLTLAAGTVLQMDSLAGIEISTGGGLMADGTSETITITGPVAQAGWWQYLWFYADSVDANCQLTYCNIEYGGGYSADTGMIHGDEARPAVHYCTIRYSESWGLAYYNVAADESNNTYSYNLSGDLRVY